MRHKTLPRIALAVGLVAAMAACGDDDEAPAAEPTAEASAERTAEASAEASAEATEASAVSESAAAESEPATGGGAGIVLAVNPWTGAAVNAQVAKVVLEAAGTPVELIEIDEFATWPGMESGDIDAVLEVWPSGHAADYETYITQNGTVVDMGELGPQAKIGWYVPTAVVEQYPELATWEGFMDTELAAMFATAESGELGQFLMGDPSYVTFDEQIIANLGLPLKYVVGGSEAAVLTALDNAVADGTPVLVQFWKPHWKHAKLDLTEVTLPEVTQECIDSAAAGDGGYACDYAPDVLYKAAAATLEEKNPAAFAFIQKFQLTTEQQNEIAAMIDGDGMDAATAAKTWVDANPDVVAGWLA